MTAVSLGDQRRVRPNRSMARGEPSARFRFDLKGKRLAAGGGVSQLQLSLQSGVSRWRIRLHELGALDLRPDELEKIVNVLRKSAEAARTQLQQIRELAERLG